LSVNSITLQVKRLPHCKSLPRYATGGSAGLDLTAAIDSPFSLGALKRGRLPTGIIVQIPEGYEGQVRARSGLADRAGICLTNGVGTIDSDYRGEIIVLVVNLGEEAYTFQPGERIAQLILCPVPKVEIEEVEEVDEGGNRGAGGFGSTGRIHIAVEQTMQKM
jgi:dUTP pyrophosphatase